MNNLILIGMPGAGKSTIGVILAKRLSKQFIDTDLLIQNYYNAPLQHIMDTSGADGYLTLRKYEENVILRLAAENSVIATGGSAVYSEKAMKHLKENGIVIYLKATKSELLRRIDNYETRGIAKAKDQTFDSLFDERTKLYEAFCDITVECSNKRHDDIVNEILQKTGG